MRFCRICSAPFSPTTCAVVCSPECRAEHRRRGRKAWAEANPDRKRELNRAHRERHRARLNEATRAAKYGITVEELRALGDTCYICGAPGEHVDHNHKTGRVRQMLCRGCNFALGFMNDDPVRLRAAANYLEEHDRPYQ